MGAVRLSHRARACFTAPSPAPDIGVISQICNGQFVIHQKALPFFKFLGCFYKSTKSGSGVVSNLTFRGNLERFLQVKRDCKINWREQWNGLLISYSG